MPIIIHKNHYWLSGTKKTTTFYACVNEQFRRKTEVKKWSLLDVTHGPRDTEERRKDGGGGQDLAACLIRSSALKWKTH